LRGGDILVRIEKSIEIGAPREKVWEMLAFDKAVEWMEGWKSVEYTSEVKTHEDKYKVGASAHITEHVKYDYEITESLKNEKIVWHSAGSRSKPKMTVSYIMKPTETGTVVTTVFDYTSPFSVLGKIVDKAGGQRIAEKDTEKSLEKLKSILEK
jgi:uncharacterized membrane protein